MLEDRSKQSVVADNEWPMLLPRSDVIGDATNEFEINQRVERIRRGLCHNHRNSSLRFGGARGLAQLCLIDAVGKADRSYAVSCQCARHQRLGAAVKRLGV